MKVKYALVLLSLLISSMELFAQEVIDLKGCVYDEQKTPVPGAAVYLKDRPGVGVSTDIDGEFSIKATIGDILVVSFIGYKTQEKLITKQEKIIITLSPETEELEEVVITGLGTSQRKVSLVGAITNVEIGRAHV